MLKKPSDDYITIELPNRYQSDDRTKFYDTNRQLSESEITEVLQALERSPFTESESKQQAGTFLSNKLYLL
jgi:hypothetical protein